MRASGDNRMYESIKSGYITEFLESILSLFFFIRSTFVVLFNTYNMA